MTKSVDRVVVARYKSKISLYTVTRGIPLPLIWTQRGHKIPLEGVETNKGVLAVHLTLSDSMNDTKPRNLEMEHIISLLNL